MKSFYPLFFSLFFISSFFSYGQSVSIDLISSGGSTSNFNNGSISFSVGECIVTADNTSQITNAGFQQGIYLLTSIGQIVDGFNPIRIIAYPNPTSDIVNFSIEDTYDLHQNFDIKVYTADSKQINISANKSENTLSLRNLANGIYFIDVSVKNHHQIFKIIKTY